MPAFNTTFVYIMHSMHSLLIVSQETNIRIVSSVRLMCFSLEGTESFIGLLFPVEMYY
jgi:hypothetical protein